MQKFYLYKLIKALKKGEIIVYPTDTLYAFGVDIYNEKAVRKIFKVKKRPLDTPLSIAVHGLDELKHVAFVDDTVKYLVTKFLTGLLTIVLREKSSVPDVVPSGLGKVAVRIPNNYIALELLSRYGPLTVTSANFHGKEVPDVIDNIKILFNNNDITVYLDYGRLKSLPSTMIDVVNGKPRIIRAGKITKKELLDVI
jgi:L-threonylcarbamoyladenylate synthase